MSSSPVQSYAFVTLLSSSAYLAGALVLAHSLRALHPKASSPIPFKLVCLVTPETVDAKSIRQLRQVWDLVVGVEVLECPGQQAGLDLLGRADLSTVLTKLHVFRLAPFTKVIFLDADVLPLRALSHLFALPHPFSAAPDTGWPDCFNSGVMVLEPSEATFEGLRAMMLAGQGQRGGGSFDGGDQGILNQYFNGEDGRPEWNRISFTYNTTPTAAYTYAPAYSHYGPTISCVHFIGANKPWSSLSYRASRPAPSENLPFDYQSLVDRWFGVYDKHVRPSIEAADKFEVPANIAAWEAPRQKTAALGLEELKRVATQGWAQTTAPTGGYTSLPLDGRIDLMRPRLASPELTASTLSPPASPEHSPETATRVISPQPIHPSGAAYFAQWDPARGPPPKGEGRQFYQMQEPIDSRYGNTWDGSEQEKKQAEKRWREGGQGGQAVWEVPKELRDGRYNVTDQQANASLVGKVFPWESRHRKTPSRVFPKGDSPPHPTSPGEQPRSSHHLQQPRPQPPYQPAPAPQNFHQAMKSYSNAWDAVPAIQKYVTKLTEPTPSTAHAGADGARTPPGGRGRRDDRSGGSGQRKEPSRDGADGDDEEEEESEESEPQLDGSRGLATKRRDGRGGGGAGAGTGSTGGRGTSRGGGGRAGGGAGASEPSSSSAGDRASSSHGYQHTGAQTDPAGELRDAGVQYESGSDSLTSGSSTPTNSSQERERTSIHSPRDQRPPTAGSAHSLVPVPPLRSVAGPSSPQEEMASLKRYSFNGPAAANKSNVPRGAPASTAPTAPDLAHTRQESTETVTSVGTSAGVVTPPTESVPKLGGPGAARGGGGAPKGRSWDPARNVDQFRSETVSVLERFMRSAQEQQQQQQQ